jgi:hypothetical protein
LYSPSTGAEGFGEVNVITRPTSITVTRSGSTTALSSIRIAPGAVLEFGVTATYHYRPVIAQLNSYTFSVTGDIGEITDDGVFRASMIIGELGTITVGAGGRNIEIQVEISGFEDMVDHWAREFVEYLLQVGITKGVSDTQYAPSQLMKRGDFILMLYRAAGEPELTSIFGFDDVEHDAYYARALIWARKMEIAHGLDGNNFYPQEPLTRQDAFTFTYRALSAMEKEYTDGSIDELDGFPDAEMIEEYAVIPIATLIRLGVVDGMNGIISPESTLTRAQMAKVLAVTLQL